MLLQRQRIQTFCKHDTFCIYWVHNIGTTSTRYLHVVESSTITIYILNVVIRISVLLCEVAIWLKPIMALLDRGLFVKDYKSFCY